ncbi:hypothetical protein GCM10009827_048450 [Dactylosporangium maewongense]|uniref:Uncharacterized protein n=1 Tax=Dactylosporangium maewongense TaxID=634393 RepID=A0ABN2AU42_9ACTN
MSADFAIASSVARRISMYFAIAVLLAFWGSRPDPLTPRSNGPTRRSTRAPENLSRVRPVDTVRAADRRSAARLAVADEPR